MKKLIICAVLFLSISFPVNASLINDKGTEFDCKDINIKNCYKKIDCPGYIYFNNESGSIKLDGNYYCENPKVLIEKIIDNPEETPSISCLSNQIFDGTKCVKATTYCFDKYGSRSQYDEIKKECVCKSGYEFEKSVSGITTCREAKPKTEPAPIKQEMPASAIVPVVSPAIVVPDVQTITAVPETNKNTPEIVQKPKVETTSIQDAKEADDPIAEPTEVNQTKNIEPQSPETVETPAPIQESTPVPAVQSQKEPNFIVRFFQSIAGWFGGWWK